MGRFSRVSAVLALGLLAACTRTAPPAPVTGGYAGQRSAAPTPAEIVNSGPSSVVVQPGETLFALARTANVPVRSVIEANNLQPPYKLTTGQVLTIPRVRQHIVQPGETLYSVSRQFGVDSTALARMNNLSQPYTIKIGLPLVLPAPVGGVPATATAAAPIPPGEAAGTAGGGAVTQSLVPPPAAPATPPGTGPSPADQVAADIAAEKASEKAGTEKAGKPATLAPPPAPAVATAPPPPAVVPPAVLVPPAQPTPPATADTAQPTDAAPPQQEAVARPEPPPVVAEHRPPTAPLFFWPVRGRVIAGYGAAAGGAHNDGINIEAPSGTTVSAADGGTVAYAGNELRGFGNLILIKHADGWVSAYAHNRTLLVKKGDHVRRGQPIAQVGATGSVGTPQLHFELRRDRRAIDPLDHLPQLSSGES
ncbi:MAG TPA: peptidoglycan DD-metalloendopeptidase family protein [Stellaceae bacterium]|nr:peptidoglycan DD-metalloendopeptidase family protein [Stellaceae bacterium]